MRTFLGVVALLIGVPLVLFAVFGVFVCVEGWNREPQFCRPLLGWAIMALLLGALLSLIGIALSSSAGESGQRQAKPSEYRVCLHCGLKTNPGWREHCQICGKPLEQTISNPPQSTHH